MRVDSRLCSVFDINLHYNAVVQSIKPNLVERLHISSYPIFIEVSLLSLPTIADQTNSKKSSSSSVRYALT